MSLHDEKSKELDTEKTLHLGKFLYSFIIKDRGVKNFNSCTSIIMIILSLPEHLKMVSTRPFSFSKEFVKLCVVELVTMQLIAIILTLLRSCLKKQEF